MPPLSFTEIGRVLHRHHDRGRSVVGEISLHAVERQACRARANCLEVDRRERAIAVGSCGCRPQRDAGVADRARFVIGSEHTTSRPVEPRKSPFCTTGPPAGSAASKMSALYWRMNWNEAMLVTFEIAISTGTRSWPFFTSPAGGIAFIVGPASCADAMPAVNAAVPTMAHASAAAAMTPSQRPRITCDIVRSYLLGARKPTGAE